MKLFFVISFIILFNNCSFDNKTGIWKNEDRKLVSNDTSKKEKNFKSIISTSNFSLKEISPNKNFEFNLGVPKKNLEWNDVYYNKNNNLDHFSYTDQNAIVIKSEKISRYELSPQFLFSNNRFFFTDKKGNLIIYSIEKELISKFNFYKNKYKKIEKKLDIIIQNDMVYISDNLGYIYAFNYKKNILDWAKYYKIPFRSNLKISQNKLVASDQNNNIYFLNKENGNILKFIPTEETILKKKFRNNISIGDNSLIFLNTFGSLYSIDYLNLKMNWFLNLNKSLDLGPSNLFSGNQVVAYKDKIFISSNDNTYIIDDLNGNIIFKKNFASEIRPVLHNNLYITATKNNFLIAININNGEIIYSINFNKHILNSAKGDNIKPSNLFIANNKIFVFLNNSYFVNFSIDGIFLRTEKLPATMKSDPIFVENSLHFLDKKKRLTVVN